MASLTQEERDTLSWDEKLARVQDDGIIRDIQAMNQLRRARLYKRILEIPGVTAPSEEEPSGRRLSTAKRCLFEMVVGEGCAIHMNQEECDIANYK